MRINSNFMSATDVAVKLGIGVSTVWAMKKRGDLPEATHLGPRTTRWKTEEIEKLFLARGGIVSTDTNKMTELSMRDQFAMAAMPVVNVGTKTFQDIACSAYKIADAMIEARKEKK